MPKLIPQLDHAVYHQRIKLRGYNGRISVFMAASDRDAAKVLKRLKPDWTPEDHASLAKKHAEAAEIQKKEWSRLVNQAAMETFGRPFEFIDYKISGIARDEFSEGMKTALRFAAHAETYHGKASQAHAMAARRQ